MKLNRSILLSIPFAALIIGASFSYSHLTSDKGKEIVILKTMIDGFKNYHYNPLEVDNDFSSKLYNSYLDRIDGAKRFLVQDDITQLSKYETLLDESMKDDISYEFFDMSVLLVEAGISRAKEYYQEALEKDFDFTKDEDIELDGEKRKFAKDYNDQKERWTKSIKYEILTRVVSKKENEQENLKEDADYTVKSDEELEEEARKDVKKVFDKWFKRLESTKRRDRLDLYLNSIAGVYDPHTNYYAPIEKENFDIGMKGKLEGIGARLQSDGEETKVTEIISGGPAWKQGELKANDIILKAAEGDAEPVDLSGMLINEVVSYIRGKKGTEVKLTVKSSDGTERVISIIRDIVITNEGYAKSLILDYSPEKIKNIGYIKLPRFYADFDDPEGRQCSEDVAQEIKKLKKQGVKSIILDLRDNGGGSLRDVVRMSGLFIEEGPIVQVKARNFKPRIHEDTDDRVLFDGHLIVMVNQFSASASEILAAAMQDYNRAVIIGSTSTFGKGTVQRFVDLDEMVWGKKDMKPLGSVKMTIQKFYRIDGGSTQLKGVVPDVILPDSYQKIDIGEKEYDYAMEWTQIDPVEYDQDVRQVKNLDKLIANSKKRVTLNKTFQLINDNASRFKKVRDDSNYSLNLETYTQERQAELDEAKKYESIMEDDIEGIGVKNLPTDLEKFKVDAAKGESNDKWIKNIKKDVYIQEALLVMKDMLK